MSLYLSCHVSLLLLFVVYFITRTTQNEQHSTTLNPSQHSAEIRKRYRTFSLISTVCLESHNASSSPGKSGEKSRQTFSPFHHPPLALIHKQIVSTHDTWGDDRSERGEQITAAKYIYFFVVAGLNFVNILLAFFCFNTAAAERARRGEGRKKSKKQNLMLNNARHVYEEKEMKIHCCSACWLGSCVLYVSMYIPKSSSRHTTILSWRYWHNNTPNAKKKKKVENNKPKIKWIKTFFCRIYSLSAIFSRSLWYLIWFLFVTDETRL